MTHYDLLATSRVKHRDSPYASISLTERSLQANDYLINILEKARRNINKIKKGEYVINMLGKQVMVLHVVNKVFRNVLMVKIKNNYKSN